MRATPTPGSDHAPLFPPLRPPPAGLAARVAPPRRALPGLGAGHDERGRRDDHGRRPARRRGATRGRADHPEWLGADLFSRERAAQHQRWFVPRGRPRGIRHRLWFDRIRVHGHPLHGRDADASGRDGHGRRPLHDDGRDGRGRHGDRDHGPVSLRRPQRLLRHAGDGGAARRQRVVPALLARDGHVPGGRRHGRCLPGAHDRRHHGLGGDEARPHGDGRRSIRSVHPGRPSLGRLLFGQLLHRFHRDPERERAPERFRHQPVHGQRDGRAMGSRRRDRAGDVELSHRVHEHTLGLRERRRRRVRDL